MTMRPRSPCCSRTRRARARIEPTDVIGESSMINGISSRPTARPISVHCFSDGAAPRNTSDGTLASLDNTRCDSSYALISKLKKMTGRIVRRATLTAIFNAKALLPIPGRAPITCSAPGWNPSRISSNLRNPVVTPDSWPGLFQRSSIFSSDSPNSSDSTCAPSLTLPADTS